MAFNVRMFMYYKVQQLSKYCLNVKKIPIKKTTYFDEDLHYISLTKSMCYT